MDISKISCIIYEIGVILSSVMVINYGIRIIEKKLFFYFQGLLIGLALGNIIAWTFTDTVILDQLIRWLDNNYILYETIIIIGSILFVILLFEGHLAFFAELFPKIGKIIVKSCRKIAVNFPNFFPSLLFIMNIILSIYIILMISYNECPGTIH